jgi:hypothetical protein
MCDFSEEKLQMLKDANGKMRICEDQSVEKNKNLIFVYCPPKVGSTSLVTSFRLCALNKYTIFHIHDELMLKVLCGIENVTINEIINYNKSLGKNVYVIDIYRSPIERKMSEYFEKLCDLHFNNKPEEVKNYNLHRITKRFNEIFNHIGTGDHYIDKYDIPIIESFDAKRKYQMQSINNITYIKLRLKDSLQWSSILSKILNRKIYIIRDYETENKEIGDLYKKFKSEYKLPLNLYESIVKDDYLAFYYTEEEREEYLKEWLKRVCDKCETWSTKEYDFYKRISIENLTQNDIQKHHYIDLGCTCKYCSTKRLEIIEKVKRGEEITEKIIHEELVKKEKYQMLLQTKQMRKPINRKVNLGMFM